MPPRRFRLALTVFYEDSKAIKHAETFLNSTIEVMEPERMIDTDAVFLYLTLASIAAAIGMILFSECTATYYIYACHAEAELEYRMRVMCSCTVLPLCHKSNEC